MSNNDGDGDSTLPEQRPMAQPDVLRRWLRLGAAGMVLSIALSAWSLWLFRSEDLADESFGLTDVLDMATVLPQILALVAMLKLARWIDSVALWRSSIGVFGCLWLLAALTPFQSIEKPALWEVILTLLIAMGMAGLVAALIRRPWYRAIPIAGRAAAEPPDADMPAPADGPIPLDYETPKPKSNEWAVGLTFAFIWIVLRRLFRMYDWIWPVFMVAAAALMLVGLVTSTIVWGTFKLRLRNRLGKWAAISGWTDLAMVGVGVTSIAAILWLAVRAGEESLPAEARLPIVILGIASILWQAALAMMLVTAVPSKP